MIRGSYDASRRRLVFMALLALLTTGPGCKGCAKKRPKVNPWARALPKTTAAYGLPPAATARVTINRRQLLVMGKPLLKLKDGRLQATSLRDGVDGLYLSSLAEALRRRAPKNEPGSGSPGGLAIHCQPAVPFRTLRAVIYTAMRTGFHRPWLVAEGAGGRRVGLPLELASVPSHLSHGLRPSSTRTPALAVGVQRRAVHVTRWGRPDCPFGTVPKSSACVNLSALPGPGGKTTSLGRYLLDRYRKAGALPGRRRPPSNAVMVWAGLDDRVGPFVALLDALREAPGGAGSCKIVPEKKTHRWRRTSPLLDPKGTSSQGCLYYQTVLVWSRPGHRKQ